ncbi:hypothetical protein [Glycomyces tenuis]|uniref:hypothetical protein n=1 Tax=Glycomyces tenuis TaxID=58116 RepID=UPI0012DF5EB0|nr:hypothetical protein [Glycomyces tenuis]
MVARTHFHQTRLDRGWTKEQLIGRMRVVAGLEQQELPDYGQLSEFLYAWEIHREEIPEPFAGLLERIMSLPATAVYHNQVKRVFL